jgi:hypothetical protein
MIKYYFIPLALFFLAAAGGVYAIKKLRDKKK